MAFTNNTINAPLPLDQTQGGTSVATPLGQYEFLVGQGNGSSSEVFNVVVGAPAIPTKLVEGDNISLDYSVQGEIAISASSSGFVWYTAANGVGGSYSSNAGWNIVGLNDGEFFLEAGQAQGRVTKIFNNTDNKNIVIKPPLNSGQLIRYGALTVPSLTSSHEGDFIEITAIGFNILAVTNTFGYPLT